MDKIIRRKSSKVMVGSLQIGGGADISVQSMTNTFTKDVKATVSQILQLEEAGCEIIRVAVADDEDAEAIKEIKQQIHIPIVADIHFDYRLALKSIENGIDKLRINPGNIGGTDRVKKVVEKAKERNIPIRIGVNVGSIHRDILKKYGGPNSEATFCRPAKGSDKGGVENAGKEAVRKFFVPYPEVDSFEELNEYLHNECNKLLENNPKWEAEKAALRPLPATRFDGARYKEAKVNRYSMVQFETNRYSLPTMYVGERVTVKATADEVKILYKGAIIASHRRVYGQYQEEIKLDHYLELLLQKPRALDNTKVYKPNTLAPIYEQYRRSLNARNHKGNREFVRILMLHRDYPPALVTEAVEIAMAYNVYSYDGVLNILGQLLVSGRPKIVPVSKDKLQNIPEVVVIPPDLSKYSVLMSGGGK
jgi:hypothetical protein